TTAEPTTNAPEFAANDESVVIDEANKQVTLPAETGTEDFKQLVTIGSFSVTDAEGNALSEDTLIGTGCKIQLLDGEGNVVSEYTVIVLSDVDGNGKITAADARLALRTAAQLDTLEGVYAIAADFDADSAIKPSDARSILRVAAKLD
ncbi:MAG: hypothetical protein LUG85_04890, partial [Clostridiales bacterium]|nr:hypothetical protein [Clostridiales bacterium]